ncbi:MAG: hypothetical protein K2P40_09265 [Lachnospiraceae bacterium]|nr:hypothetical protein [Lachnospiraceae bacterium]
MARPVAAMTMIVVSTVMTATGNQTDCRADHDYRIQTAAGMNMTGMI